MCCNALQMPWRSRLSALKHLTGGWLAMASMWKESAEMPSATRMAASSSTGRWATLKLKSDLGSDFYMFACCAQAAVCIAVPKPFISMALMNRCNCKALCYNAYSIDCPAHIMLACKLQHHLHRAA